MVHGTIGLPVHTVALPAFIAPAVTARGAVATGLLQLPASRMELKLDQPATFSRRPVQDSGRA